MSVIISIHLPTLRERKEDIPLLIEHFINKYSKEYNKPAIKAVRLLKRPNRIWQPCKSGWAYLGHYVNTDERWKTKYFKFSDMESHFYLNQYSDFKDGAEAAFTEAYGVSL